jgi:hypothetical protein
MTAAQTSAFPPPTAVEQVKLRFLGDALSCDALDVCKPRRNTISQVEEKNSHDAWNWSGFCRVRLGLIGSSVSFLPLREHDSPGEIGGRKRL